MSGKTGDHVSALWLVPIFAALLAASYFAVTLTSDRLALTYVDEVGRPIPKEKAEAWLKKNESRQAVQETTPSRETYDCNADQQRAAQAYIVAHGYSCVTVDACSPGLWGKSVRVNCNGFRYKYTLEDHGGKWSVTAH